MTCKKCIYYKICKANAEDRDWFDEYSSRDFTPKHECKEFEDKESYIKPIFKPGNKAYFLVEGKIEEIKIKSVTITLSEDFLPSFWYEGKMRYKSIAFDNTEIGKTIFNTHKKAKRKLEKK